MLFSVKHFLFLLLTSFFYFSCHAESSLRLLSEQFILNEKKVCLTTYTFPEGRYEIIENSKARYVGHYENIGGLKLFFGSIKYHDRADIVSGIFQPQDNGDFVLLYENQNALIFRAGDMYYLVEHRHVHQNSTIPAGSALYVFDFEEIKFEKLFFFNEFLIADINEDEDKIIVSGYKNVEPSAVVLTIKGNVIVDQNWLKLSPAADRRHQCERPLTGITGTPKIKTTN